MIERTLCAWISSLESPDDIARAFFKIVRAFAFRHQVLSRSFQLSCLLGPRLHPHEDEETERQQYRSHQRQHKQLVRHRRERRTREIVNRRVWVSHSE